MTCIRRAVKAKQESEALRANRNKLSKQIGVLMGQAKQDPSKKEEAEAVKAQVSAQAEEMKRLTAEAAELTEKVRSILLTIPNIIDPSVPIGPDDSYNVEVQRFGEPVVPDFEVPYHTDIMDKLQRRRPGQPPAVSAAAASTTCWAISPGCTRPCWPTPGIS